MTLQRVIQSFKRWLLRIACDRTPGLARKFANFSERIALRINVYLSQKQLGSVSRPQSQSTKLVPSKRQEKAVKPTGVLRLLDDIVARNHPISECDLLGLLDRNGLLSENGFERYLRALFDARQIERLEGITADDAIGHRELRLFYSARVANFQGRTGPDIGELEELLDKKKGILKPHQIVNLLVERTVREGRDFNLVQMLTKHREMILGAVRDANMLGCLRLLCQKEHVEFARELLLAHLDRIPKRRQMLFVEQISVLLPEQTASFGSNWREISKTFRDYGYVDGANEWEFVDRFLLSPLLALPNGGADFMDIRLDRTLADQLLQRIGDHLTRAAPYSLIRLGDGEAYAFSTRDLEFLGVAEFENHNMLREQHWWAIRLDEARRYQIANSVRDAAANADILGVPSIYRIVRDVAQGVNALGVNVSQSGLAIVLNAIGKELPLTGKVFTEERCHQIIFTPQSLLKLSQMARRTIVISCWEKGQLRSFQGVNADFIVVASHAKVANLVKTKRDPLPLNYEEVCGRIRDLAVPGTLVLVAAGLIGKIFIHEARRCGAVAIDVGAVLDYDVGYKTRSIADMV